MMTRLAAPGARRLLAGLFLALALVSQAPAQQPEDALARAEAQVNAGDYGTAISALRDMGTQAVREAELRRLWALSMAHVRQGRPRAAQPFLDRLVSLAPDAVTYRLELANALEAAGQPERARYHYALARGAALPPPLATEVTRRIDRIDRARVWEGNFRFAIVPESNPAKRTASDTILIGDLPFKLKDGSRAQPARGIELGLGLAALPQLGPDLRLRLGQPSMPGCTKRGRPTTFRRGQSWGCCTSATATADWAPGSPLASAGSTVSPTPTSAAST